jgi:hypothetical protein
MVRGQKEEKIGVDSESTNTGGREEKGGRKGIAQPVSGETAAHNSWLRGFLLRMVVRGNHDEARM